MLKVRVNCVLKRISTKFEPDMVKDRTKASGSAFSLTFSFRQGERILYLHPRGKVAVHILHEEYVP